MQTAKFAQQISSMADRYTKIRDHLTTAQNALEKLSELNLRDMDGFISGVDAVLSSGDAVASSLTGSASDVTEAFQSSFPAFDEDLLGELDPADVLEQRMTGLHNNLQMLRKHTRQIDQAQDVLADVSSQLSGATSPEQVREAAATLQQFQVQNGQLMRQLMVRRASRRTRERAAAITNHRQLSASLDQYFQTALGETASEEEEEGFEYPPVPDPTKGPPEPDPIVDPPDPDPIVDPPGPDPVVDPPSPEPIVDPPGPHPEPEPIEDPFG